MEISRSTVPGVGVVHHLRTRGGQSFGVLVDESNHRTLMVYGCGRGEAADVDEPLETIVLDGDEADQVAEMLHNRAIADRLATVERRLAQLVGEAS
ncbi:hypothetical protein [Antrihabitans cavernicola]|uniref:Potassium/proton antiporter subunit KhtT-like N-terminal domain-containing protein n=1 Tax=Antrihabitans cavernicola TaxID=2495913 RepID=A0A5A7SFB6_9NOCA|nr:hypothetical protein [Spelaeibacter cavernicola]KAA0024818.1 hypothetical protein FOY51_02495 [Spelaeibacter cavernicola]